MQNFLNFTFEELNESNVETICRTTSLIFLNKRQTPCAENLTC